MSGSVQFADEVERFTLRVQGLASKAELVELVAAESAVSDEASSRRYVAVMRQIATRHGISDLVRSFELWSFEEDEGEEPSVTA